MWGQRNYKFENGVCAGGMLFAVNGPPIGYFSTHLIVEFTDALIVVADSVPK